MKKLISVLLSVVMSLSLVTVPAFAETTWNSYEGGPVTSLSIEGLNGANTGKLKVGDKVKATVTVSNSNKYWNSYQFELDYDATYFELDRVTEWGETNFDAETNCAEIKALFGADPTVNDTSGKLIVTGSTSALVVGKFGPKLSDPSGTSPLLVPITAFTATFTVSAVEEGGSDFSIATTGTTFYQLGFTDSSKTTTSTGTMTESVTFDVAPTINSGATVTLDKVAVEVNGTDGGTVNAAVVSKKGTDLTANSGITWSVTPAEQGVTVGAHTGVVTVGAKAEDGTYTVTATADGTNVLKDGDVATAYKIFEVTRVPAVPATVTITPAANELEVPTDATPATAVFNATVLDQYGDEMNDPTVEWAIKDGVNAAPTGITITDGTVTVTSAASEDITDTTGKALSVTATCGGVTSEPATLTVKRAAAILTSFELSLSSSELIVPKDDTPATLTVSAANGKDQYGSAYTLPDFAAEIVNIESYTGISLLQDKTVSVSKAASRLTDTTTTVTVKGTIGTVTATKTFTVTHEALTATTVEIVGVGESDIIGIPGSKTYAATVKDQYGYEMSGQTVNWTLPDEDNEDKTNITLSGSTVSVANDNAADGKKAVLTATCNGKSDSVTIEAKKVSVDFNAYFTLKAPAEITYGDSAVSAFTKTSTSGTAKAYIGGVETDVSGTFAISAADLSAGDKTVTVKFTVTQECAYKGTELTKTYSVKVNPKPVALSWTVPTYTFDNTPHSVTATVTNKAVDNDNFTLAYSDNTKTNAGTYTAKVTGLGNDNYTLTGATNDTKEWKINPKALTADMVTLGANPNYNKAEQTISVTVTDDAAAITSDDYTVTGDKATNVGNYTVTVTGKGNYAGTVTKSWQMLKAAQPTPVVITGAANKTFGDEPFEVTVSGGDGTGAYSVVSSDTSVLTVAKKDDITFTVTIVNAGSADLTATKAGDTNYADKASDPFAVTVAKANRTVNVENTAVTLLPNALTATVVPSVNAGSNDVSYTYSSSNTAAVTVNNAGLMTAVANGSATITVTATGKNYNDATKTFTVTAWATVPVEGVTHSGGTLTAAVEGDKIVLSGYQESETPITVGLVFTDGSGFTSTREGDKIDVKFNGTVVATYTVDESNVVVKSANVVVSEAAAPEVKTDGMEGDSVKAAAALNDSGTRLSGVLESAFKALQNEAEKLFGGDVTAVTVEIGVGIEAKELSDTKFALDITPVYTVKDKNDPSNVLVDGAQVPNGFFTTPITVKVKLPVGFPTAKLVAKHTKADGTVEWLKVTVDSGYASWQMSSFSVVELIVDERSVTVDFNKADGSVETVTYHAYDIGSAFPNGGSGYRGWKFYQDDGTTVLFEQTGTQSTLSDELLTKLNDNKALAADNVQAVAEYSHGGGGGGGGGAAGTAAEVSVAKASNGTVSANVAKAKKGDTVTVTVTPKDGYKLDTLTVTDKNGKTVTLKKVSDTKYTFTMPDGKVSIAATFVEGKTETTMSFTDVAAGDWYYDAVKYAFDNGLMNGTGDGQFSPNATTTRGMIFTVLARNAGVDTTGGETWYTVGMNWAKEQGISDGTMPEGNITREQLATMLYRVAKNAGKGFTGSWMFLLDYPDAASVSDWANEAMHWCVMKGIVNGKDGKLVPTGNATRAEVATMLMRFLELDK